MKVLKLVVILGVATAITVKIVIPAIANLFLGAGIEVPNRLMRIGAYYPWLLLLGGALLLMLLAYVALRVVRT